MFEALQHTSTYTHVIFCTRVCSCTTLHRRLVFVHTYIISWLDVLIRTLGFSGLKGGVRHSFHHACKTIGCCAATSGECEYDPIQTKPCFARVGYPISSPSSSREPGTHKAALNPEPCCLPCVIRAIAPGQRALECKGLRP